MSNDAEIYFSVDVEANGPIPGPFSMWSLGAAAFFEGRVVGTFSVNLEDLKGSAGDPDTLAWWAKQPREIFEAARKDPQPPQKAMGDFVSWVGRLSGEHKARPVCVAYPAGYDFLFVYWYIINEGFSSPFSFSCLDIKTYAMATLNIPYRQATKKNMPKRWFQGLPQHTHVAEDDALEQGMLFLNMQAERRRADP